MFYICSQQEAAIRRAINPNGVSPPFYSHGLELTAPQRLLFISGQVGIRPDGSIGADMAEQAALAVGNLTAVLSAAGLTTANLVKLTFYLVEEADAPAFYQAAAALLVDPPAAATMLYVKALADPALRVEIEAVAAA